MILTRGKQKKKAGNLETVSCHLAFEASTSTWYRPAINVRVRKKFSNDLNRNNSELFLSPDRRKKSRRR